MRNDEKILLDKLNKLFPTCRNNYVVDIGASNNSFFTGFSELFGLLIDKDSKKLKKYGSQFTILNKKITPDNVVSVLKEYNVPTNFLALNIDIDSYDLFVLIAILKAGYKPDVIVTEINEKIPPDVYFTILYEQDWEWQRNHFYGYGISCISPLLKKYNYSVHELCYNNLILTRGEGFCDIRKAYVDGYLNRTDRKDLFSYNMNVDYWGFESEDVINDYFEKYSGLFSIGNECKQLIHKALDEK